MKELTYEEAKKIQSIMNKNGLVLCLISNRKTNGFDIKVVTEDERRRNN